MYPDLLSDLIKIGTPSIVALAGTVSAVVIARAGHTHAQMLEKERNHFTQVRDEEHRRHELLKAVAIEVTRIGHHLVAYNSILFAKQETLARNEVWPEADEEMESEARQELLAAFHAHVQTQAFTLMLGEDNLSNLHAKYLACISSAMECDVDGSELSAENINQLIDDSKLTRSAIIRLISKLYFPLRSSTSG